MKWLRINGSLCQKPRKTRRTQPAITAVTRIITQSLGGKSTQFQQNSRPNRRGYQTGGQGGTRGGKQFHKELTQEEAEQFENYSENCGEDGSPEFDTSGTFLEEEQGQ